MTDTPEDQLQPTKLWILLDRSGSMARFGDTPITAINELISEQRSGPGDCRFSLVLFDTESPFEVVVNDQPIADAQPLSERQYYPRGGTPLLDAVGRLITTADQRLAERRDGGFPNEDQTIAIFTDGLENASREYDLGTVRSLIEARRAEGWQFLFLATNQDAFEEAGRLGVAPGNVVQFDASAEGLHSANRRVSEVYTARRHMAPAERAVHQEAAFDASDEQRTPKRNRRRRK